MIRVLIADDHSTYRQALAFMLDRESDMSVVGQVSTIAAARPLFSQTDVAIVDLDLGGETGISLIQQMREKNSDVSALVVTAALERAELGRAIEVGASGVLHKSSSIEEVISAIRKLNQGLFLHSPIEVVELLRIAARSREEGREAERALSQLTPRELDVLHQLAFGLSDSEIAERLMVSVETIRTHMVSILRKLQVNSRLQAVVFAVRHGAVTIS